MINSKEIFESVVSSIDISNITVGFKFGYWNSVANELLDEGRAKILERFPLIFLHADYEENVLTHSKIRVNPTFYIITQTEKNYTFDQRIEKVYEAILYPIYGEFIKQIRRSKKFWISKGEIPHVKKDLYYLQGSQNKINCIVDAIELKFSQLDLFKDAYHNYDV